MKTEPSRIQVREGVEQIAPPRPGQPNALGGMLRREPAEASATLPGVR